MDDLYQILGVRRNASVGQIRRAYQKSARQFHPDLNPGDPIAFARFQAASRAFEILSDAKRRAQYDRGEEEALPIRPTPEVGFEGFDFSVAMESGRAVFRDIFGGLQDGPLAGGPIDGEDLEQKTRITFAECLSGTQRRIQVVRMDRCPVCQGAGVVAFGPVPCPRCEGTGRQRVSRGHMVFSRPCLDCDSTGRISRRACPQCGGEGRLMRSEWLEIEIPPGVGDGSRVRLPGCGNAGRKGGAAGDFILSVEVESHPTFEREGDDLTCQVGVSMITSALGGHIEVPTPDGPMTIEIPAGTQNDQRFRLRKRGMPKFGEKGRGDLFVRIRVEIPAVTDDRGRELLHELAGLDLHYQKPNGVAPEKG